MRAPVLVLLTALCLLSPVALALGPAGEAQRYLVGFHEWTGLERGDRYLDGEVVDVDEALRFAVVATTLGPLFELRAQSEENVRYLELDGIGLALYVPNDARYNDAGHYGSKRIGAETAWDRTRGSTAVKVAIIDSGLRKTHEEFAGSGRVLQGYDTISEDLDPQDTCGHGTHVAGTIGATINNGKGIAGMAQASLFPIRGLTSDLLGCSGTTANLAQALRIAGDEGAHLSSNSWGGATSTAIADAIAYAHAKGVVHVAAAGNDGSCTNCVGEPWRSNADKVIIVSSTDAADAFSSFSSQGSQVDVAAPGSNILSAYTSNDASYTTLSGTSMATPHVTGTAALLKTLNPSWSFADIDNRLKTTAKDLGAAGKDDRFGYGRIDAAAATAGGSPPPTNQPPTACYSHSVSGATVSANGACSSDADGSIVSWSWSWGDGSPASSGASASHAYAASGSYTVTLTVTDNAGATASTSKSIAVTVTTSDPDPAATTLTSGQTISRTSGGAGTEQFFKIQVPAGASQLQVVLDGPACSGLLSCSPDLDLYVRKGARPTDSLYDCRPYATGSDETCTQASPAADWWYVRVDVYAGSNVAYTLRATAS